MKPVKQYPMHGEVLRLDSQGKIAAIKAGKIDGWMEAMTMEYPVKDQAEFDKLHTGENDQRDGVRAGQQLLGRRDPGRYSARSIRCSGVKIRPGVIP